MLSARRCLRDDQSGCFPPGHQYYDITHNGLDAMITRWMDSYNAFAELPDDLAFANNTLYEFINDVGGHDMVEGGRAGWGGGGARWGGVCARGGWGAERAPGSFTGPVCSGPIDRLQTQAAFDS